MAILDSFFNTLYGQDRIAGLEAKYGPGSTGQPSKARHQSAVSQLNKNLNISPTFGPGSIFTSGIASIGEIPDVMKTGDIKESLRDIRDNFIGGTLTKTPEQIYEDIYGVGSFKDIEGQTAGLGIFGPISKGFQSIFGPKMGKIMFTNYVKTPAINRSMEAATKARKEIQEKIARAAALKAAQEEINRMGYQDYGSGGASAATQASYQDETGNYAGASTQDHDTPD
tara:strand:+ start:41 stop:718 length:678 start_codon:yes stop_codon:yes gene_type:complete